MSRSTLLDGVRVDREARRTASEGLREKRTQDLRMAAAFARMERVHHHLAEGCASIGELGERLGYAAAEAWTLARAGMAVRLHPPLATLVLKGKVTLEGAAVLARVLADHRIRGRHSVSQWLYWAKKETARDLRLRVRRRWEEIRAGGRVHDVTVHLSDRGMSDLGRAQDLFANRFTRDVTPSETVERLAGYYLDREDPRRTAPGRRRVGDTTENRSRHIPEEVKRAVLERAGGRCEVPGCGKTRGLEFAHLDAHSEGGSREADNIALLCHAHHVELDTGWIHAIWINRLLFFLPGPPPPPEPRPPDRRLQEPWPRARRPASPPPFARPNPWAREVAGWGWTRTLSPAPPPATPPPREPLLRGT